MRKLIVFLLVVLAFSVNYSAQTLNRRSAPFATITSVKAMLFYDNNGTFSKDVAEEITDAFGVPSILWNTPIEGASREGAATSLLVTVELASKYSGPRESSIELTARYKPLEQARVSVVRKSQPIRIRENGKFIAGFWLYEVGCNPVTLTARVVGQPERLSVKKIIRFGCGE